MQPGHLEEVFRRTFCIGEKVFHISTVNSDVAERVSALLRTFRVEAKDADDRFEVLHGGPEGLFSLKHNGAEILRVNSVAEIIGALFQTILSRIHANETWLAVIHGGAVSIGGRAVLLPGSSGSGKSTLGAYLVACGFEYLCDDMLAVTKAGQVANWPVPISIKDGSWDALAPHLPGLKSLPAEFAWGRRMKLLPAARALSDWELQRTSVLIFPKFGRCAIQTKLTKLSPLEAFEKLISDRIWLGFPLRSKSVWRFLQWLKDIPAYALTYSSFDQVERLVREAANP